MLALLGLDQLRLAERLAAQHLEAGVVGHDRGALEREQRAEQAGARAGPRTPARGRIPAAACGERERGCPAAQGGAPGEESGHQVTGTLAFAP